MKSIVALLVIFTSGGFAQSVLTLDDAIALGRQHSRLLRISEAKVDAASAKSGEANASLLPSLKLTGSYARLSDVPPFQVQLPLPGAPPPFTISPTVLNTYTTRLTLQQPLFTGFKLLNNARAAGRLADASASDNRNDAADLDLNVATAYWTLYQVLETKKYTEENVTRLSTYRNDTENLLRAGLATRNDLLKIDVQLSNGKLAQIDAANDAQVASMNLNNTIGQPLDTEIRLASAPGQHFHADSVGGMGEGVSSDSLAGKALRDRPDLAAMQLRIESSEAGVSAAKGGWWPQVFLTGDYYYNRPNARYMPTVDAFKEAWDIGVSLQFDLWNSGITIFQTQQAQSVLQQNRLQYEQMKDNVRLDVKRFSLAIRRAMDKVAVARLAVDQAEENSRTTGDKYRNGLATSTDLIDASVALLQARTNLAGALVEYELAHARMTRALGGG